MNNRYAVELENSAGEKCIIKVKLTARQRAHVALPGVVTCCAVNSCVLENAEAKAPPGFQWHGGEIRTIMREA
jgi:hypothetical protein